MHIECMYVVVCIYDVKYMGHGEGLHRNWDIHIDVAGLEYEMLLD